MPVAHGLKIKGRSHGKKVLQVKFHLFCTDPTSGVSIVSAGFDRFGGLESCIIDFSRDSSMSGLLGDCSRFQLKSGPDRAMIRERLAVLDPFFFVTRHGLF